MGSVQQQSPSTLALDAMSQSEQTSQFLKMEDLHNQPSSSPAPSTFDSTSGSQMSPPPVVVTSKQAKKRKSWGQELPEPKTTLPPRKRAKTDDEKEQRRIERIKRNRAAAHNSRERKRQETETLAVALARANAELEAYRNLHGPLPASIVLPEVHVHMDCGDAATPAPSLVDSHGSVQDNPPSPESPEDDIFHNTIIKQEAHDSSSNTFTTLPPALENFDSKSSLLSPLDPTQHSAAMLCDLPCRSSSQSSSMTSPASWANLFLYLMTTQMQTCYKTILIAMWTLSPGRMARLMQASAIRSTSRSTTSSMTLQLLRSTPRRLALCNAATGLGAPQKGGASALLRQSLDEVDRSRIELTARQAHARCQNESMVLSQQQGVSEDHIMADDGDDNKGVAEEGVHLT